MSQKETIIAQIVGTHQAWYLAHNHGRKASQEEITDWINRLYASGFGENQLSFLLSDDKSRNQLLGKAWYQ